MGTIDATRSYTDGEILLQADLDAIVDDIEEFVNVTKLNDDNIQTGGITGSTKLVDGSVTTVKLASLTVGTNNIADSAVTTAKIVDSAITTAKITDSNITTSKIADSNITTSKIADDSVTNSKLAPLNYSLSTSCGFVNIDGTSGETDITNLSVSITTVGRPVMIKIVPDGTTSTSTLRLVNSTGVASQVYFRFYRDSTEIGRAEVYRGQTGHFEFPPSCLSTIDEPSAGTYTYKVSFQETSGNANNDVAFNNSKLLVYEL